MKINDNVKTIVFICDGGIGRNIAGTAVIRAIKKQYPDKRILVIGGAHDVFMHNPNVYRVFNFANPLYFYDDYINENTLVIKDEPYLNYGYINKEKHIVEAWCEDLGIECDGTYPDLYFLENELDSIKLYVDTITKEGTKKLVLLQWIGGKVPEDKTPIGLKNALLPMFRRSLPIEETQKLTDYLVANNYVVGIVGHKNFPDIKGAEKISEFPLRTTLALINYSYTFIGIDSFLQHAASSNQINKQGIVLWGGTSPKCLGYDKQINLTKEACRTPFCHRPNSYLFDIQAHGGMWDCTEKTACMKYTSEEIINIFERNFKK